MEIIFLLINLGLCALVGKLGSKRNIGFGWSFVLSIFLSPLVGLIITLFSKKLNTVEFIEIPKQEHEKE